MHRAYAIICTKLQKLASSIEKLAITNFTLTTPAMQHGQLKSDVITYEAVAVQSLQKS